jgi:hypothetical protein
MKRLLKVAAATAAVTAVSPSVAAADPPEDATRSCGGAYSLYATSGPAGSFGEGISAVAGPSWGRYFQVEWVHSRCTFAGVTPPPGAGEGR